MQEAASYAEGILDNMMADLVAANEGHMAAIEEAANAKVEELKLEIEEKAHADIAELEAFVEVALAELKATTAAGIEMLGESIEETLESIDEAAEELDEMESSQSESDIEVEDAEDATVSLLAAEVEVAAEPKIPSSSYVYAGMGLAGVATAAYFMMKPFDLDHLGEQVRQIKHAGDPINRALGNSYTSTRTKKPDYSCSPSPWNLIVQTKRRAMPAARHRSTWSSSATSCS